MVRGYSYGSFIASECDEPSGRSESCPVFDQLLGSRMAVANAELRFPLLGVLGLGSGYSGAFPVEFLAFADAGLPRGRSTRPGCWVSTGSGSRSPAPAWACGSTSLGSPSPRSIL